MECDRPRGRRIDDDGRVTRFRLTAPPPLKENDVEKACIDLLRLRGYWVFRIHAGLWKSMDGRRILNLKHLKGVPDYGTVHARYPGFLLEVKRPGLSATAEQLLKHREIRMGYGLAIATINRVEDLHSFINDHERRSSEWAKR